MRRAVYPASLDPIHNGHIDIAIRASKFFDEVVVAIYDMPKKKLLFTVDERVSLAEEAFKDFSNIRVAKYSGLTVNYAQQIGAMALIRGLRVFSDFEFEFRMGMANKKLAPDIETIAIMADEKHIHISSSTIREIAELDGDVSSMVPEFVKEALQKRFAELHANQNSPGYTISIRD
ncbi:MAG: pantetheine-phosphate adenylyltransferase [Chloroflexi bacterium]|nr:MAG: pantetheine-phosphate adenylyltransferase [Phototrophicales bacterium]RMF78372.1 MAG: pantetheine-phosphate adenylyltransferase [Chloroflexota bacterium]